MGKGNRREGDLGGNLFYSYGLNPQRSIQTVPLFFLSFFFFFFISESESMLMNELSTINNYILILICRRSRGAQRSCK